MGIFGNLLDPQRPVLSRADVPHVNKMLRFIRWFIDHEPHVTALSNPGCNAIFAEGYRPHASPIDDPDLMPDVQVVSLQQWFMLKVFIDLNLLKDEGKERFAEFIEILESGTTERLPELGRIAEHYDLQLEPFVYAKEMAKITDEKDLEAFKVRYLEDTVIAAETRILAWVYYLFFGEQFRFGEQQLSSHAHGDPSLVGNIPELDGTMSDEEELLEAVESREHEVAAALEAQEKHKQGLVVGALVAGGAFLLCRALDYRLATVLIVVPSLWALHELLAWDEVRAGLGKSERAVAEARARLEGYLQAKEGAEVDGD